MDYKLDDSVDKIEWKYIEKVTHLDPSLSYKKLLTEINDDLDPKYILSLNFDYESMKLLINQAYKFNIPFVNSNEKLALFISKNNNSLLKQKLYKEYGYEEPKQTAKILDPHVYKRVCNLLKHIMDLGRIESYRKKFLSKILEDELFPLILRLDPEEYILDTAYYYDKRSKPKQQYYISHSFYLDLVSEYFFDDYYENVFMDINQILKYINITNDNSIPLERLKFYRDFIYLKETQLEEQRMFYLNNKDIIIGESFYDDIRQLKDKSYKSLVDSCTIFTKDSPTYSKELSETYNCEIYYLNGEEFYGFVRSNVQVNKMAPVPSEESIKRLGHSFTYIGTYDIQTYKNPNEILTFLYTGIDPNNIGHVYHNDSWTNPKYEYFSDYTNELHTPESLLKESTKYPEIVITKLEGIKPSALLALDEPSKWDIEFSQKFNIPIVVINTKAYERKYDKEDFFKDKYTR